MKVVIVGAGMMGSGIACISALAKNETVLLATTVEHAVNGMKKAQACIDELADSQLTSAAAAAEAKSMLSAGEDLESALLGAELVIEAIYENLPAKQMLFEKLDEWLPGNVPILSNTSGLRITDIAARVKRFPERTMTAHFWLPAHLVPLVEVVLWEKTDQRMAASVKQMLSRWGKAPVLVQRDLPGQLANRILQAIIRESVNIVRMGLASPEDVDTAIKMGMGIRFPVWGPLEHIDAVGLDLALSVQETVLPEISGEKSSPYLRNMVDSGMLGNKNKKGFYDWKVRDMDELMKKRNEFIIYALKKIR